MAHVEGLVKLFDIATTDQEARPKGAAPDITVSVSDTSQPGLLSPEPAKEGGSKWKTLRGKPRQPPDDSSDTFTDGDLNRAASQAEKQTSAAAASGGSSGPPSKVARGGGGRRSRKDRSSSAGGADDQPARRVPECPPREASSSRPISDIMRPRSVSAAPSAAAASIGSTVVGSASVADDPAFAGIQESLQSLQLDFACHVTQAHEESSKMLNVLKQSSTHILEQTAALLEQRLAPIYAKLDDHRSELDFLRSELETQRLKIVALEASRQEFPSLPQSSRPAPIVSDLFDRPPDPTLVRINCSVNVRLSAVNTALVDVLSDIPKEAYKVTCNSRGGTDLGRFFSLKFVGESESAQRYCSQLMSKMYNDGDWLRLKVKPPSSLEQPLYLSKDKNPRQLRTEFQTKKLGDVLRSMVGSDSTVTVRRAKGLVLLGAAKIAQIEVVEDGPPRIQWKPSILQRYGIDKEAAQKQLSTLVQPVSAEEWCG